MVITHLHPFNALREMLPKCTRIIGHNFLSYDGPNIKRLLDIDFDHSAVVDTLVISRFLNYNIEGGHGLEAWGVRLKHHKLEFNDFSCLSDDMIKYCIGDVELNYKVYKRFEKYVDNDRFKSALKTEHDITIICNDMKSNGFAFNKKRAEELHNEIQLELDRLDADILVSFRPRVLPLRDVTLHFNKNGSVPARYSSSLVSFLGENVSFVPGAVVTTFDVVPFNPASPKQIVERLNEAGWKPLDKTKGHLQAERELKQCRDRVKREALKKKLEEYAIYGWKVNEENLETLPDTAPDSAKSLARRILLASRLSSLNEWLNAYSEEDESIHGSILGIGAWTHRMSHMGPNTANIAGEYNRKGQVSLYGKDFRKLWTVRPGRKLIGTDAEGIQLRVLAHYINDSEFTFGLVSGDKSKGTDVHSMNKRALGIVCKTRDVAKTFIYSWLLGAGEGKTAEVLGCALGEARTARTSFLEAYPGLKRLKDQQIPWDAKRGFFEGVDGRYVVCDSEHLMLAGYLQNGEAVVMKMANCRWVNQLRKEKIPFWQVNFVHDEWQTETVDDQEVAEYVASVQRQAIVDVGVELGLNCPLAGTSSIGYNWYETH